MKTRKIISILLIIASLLMGYQGLNKVTNNSVSVEILDVDLDVSNKSGQQEGYMYLGLAIILFGGGLYMMKNK